MKWRLIFGVLLLCAQLVICAGFALAENTEATLAKAWEAYNIGHYRETLQLLEPLAVDGNVRAQVLVGQCYESGLGVEQNLQTAFEWYRLASEQKDAQAMVHLAYLYEHGLGTAKDTAKTVELMQQAAEMGNAEAQFMLALYASKGQYGVSKDHTQAFEWVQKSAKQGYAQAERLLGAFYEYGIGTEKNMTIAQSWYAKAQAKGLQREDIIASMHDIPVQ